MKMYTEPDTRPLWARIPWRAVGFAVSALVLTAALVGAAVWLLPWRSAPDVHKQQPKDAAKYMVSDDFAKLSDKKRQAYFNDLRERQKEDSSFAIRRLRELSDKERENFRKNVQPLIMNVINESASTYASLPPEQRAAFIDAAIDGEMGQLASLLPQGQPWDKGPHPEFMKNQFESTKPQVMATQALFMRGVMQNLIARRMQRALDKARGVLTPAAKPAAKPGS